MALAGLLYSTAVLDERFRNGLILTPIISWCVTALLLGGTAILMDRIDRRQPSAGAADGLARGGMVAGMILGIAAVVLASLALLGMVAVGLIFYSERQGWIKPF